MVNREIIQLLKVSSAKAVRDGDTLGNAFCSYPRPRKDLSEVVPWLQITHFGDNMAANRRRFGSNGSKVMFLRFRTSAICFSRGSNSCFDVDVIPCKTKNALGGLTVHR